MAHPCIFVFLLLALASLAVTDNCFDKLNALMKEEFEHRRLRVEFECKNKMKAKEFLENELIVLDTFSNYQELYAEIKGNVSSKAIVKQAMEKWGTREALGRDKIYLISSLVDSDGKKKAFGCAALFVNERKVTQILCIFTEWTAPTPPKKVTSRNSNQGKKSKPGNTKKPKKPNPGKKRKAIIKKKNTGPKKPNKVKGKGNAKPGKNAGKKTAKGKGAGKSGKNNGNAKRKKKQGKKKNG